jgi:hypothetical protein
MQPPTITEDEEAEKAAEAGADNSCDLPPDTADTEVAEWVAAALERKRSGKMVMAGKPALHTVALDAVPRPGMLPVDRNGVDRDGSVSMDGPVITPNPGKKVEHPELKQAQVESTDFALGVGNDGSNDSGPHQDVG